MMSVIWKIAFRNIREHKSKTLIIGAIVTIGIAVLVVGNSLMDTAASGIKKNYIDNYTGHVIIAGAHRGSLSLFGSNDMEEETPVIPEYKKIRQWVAAHPDIETYSPQAIGQASISRDDELLGFTMLFGVDFARYARMFPNNLEILAGSYPSSGQEGILLSEDVAKRLKSEDGKEIVPGDRLLLTGFSMLGGTKIRELEVLGIMRFVESNPQLDMVSLIDITNLRALMGMNVQSKGEIVLSEIEQALLGEVSEEDIFGSADGGLFGGSLIADDAELVTEIIPGEADLFDPFALWGDGDGAGAAAGAATAEDGAAAVAEDDGAWHFLLLKLKNPNRVEQVRRDLATFFAEEGIAAVTQGWEEGAGVMASMTSGIQLVFNIIVMIVAVVAMIIIMNTLVISITERIAEIGTIRAIGAQKSFVRRMITCETIILSGLFGLIGILLGGLILLILNIIGIEAPNIFFRIIFGGEVLRPVLSLKSVVMSLVVVTGIGVVASWYPVSIALKIRPVRAMQSD